jgi:hypothetical protein
VKKNPNPNANPVVELFRQPLNKTAMEQLVTTGESSTIRGPSQRGSSATNANAPAMNANALAMNAPATNANALDKINIAFVPPM